MARVLSTVRTDATSLVDVEGQPYPVAPEPAGSGGVVPPLYSVVLRPGDTSGADNVFTSWAALYGACAGIPGGVRVVFDDSIVSPIVIPAGAYNVDNWEWVGNVATRLNGNAVVQLASGVRLTAQTLVFKENLSITYLDVAAPCMTVHGTALSLYLGTGGTLATSSSAAPFVLVTSAALGGELVVYSEFWILGDGTNNVFKCNGASSEINVYGFWFTTIEAHVVDNAAGFCFIFTDASSTASATQDGSVTLTPADVASNVGYTPATAGNWHPAPSFVSAALDQLAARFPGTASWYTQTNIYWDPANGSGVASDSNAGTTSLTPLLTWGEIVRRYGTTAPLMPYGQTTTYHVMSAQPAGQDPVFFQPLVSGGGQVLLDCTLGLANAGISFVAGALSGGFGFAGAAPSSGGTPLVMAGVPGYVVAGTLLQNSTRNGYAFVDSVTGGNATCTQPQTIASLTATGTIPAPAVQNTWVAGDTIQPLTLPALNLKQWAPQGGDVSAGVSPSGGWVLFAHVIDPGGAANTALPWSSHSASLVMSSCLVDSRLDVGQDTTRGFGVYVLGCKLTGGQTVIFAGEPVFAGGVTKTVQVFGGEVAFENSAMIHNALTLNAGEVLVTGASGAWSDGLVTINDGLLNIGGGAASFFWGSYGATVNAGGTYFNNGAGTFAANALLTSGAVKLGAATTGTSYSAGVWLDGVNLTAANLDANNGLQNPRSGAKFTNGA